MSKAKNTRSPNAERNADPAWARIAECLDGMKRIASDIAKRAEWLKANMDQLDDAAVVRVLQDLDLYVTPMSWTFGDVVMFYRQCHGPSVEAWELASLGKPRGRGLDPQEAELHATAYAYAPADDSAVI